MTKSFLNLGVLPPAVKTKTSAVPMRPLGDAPTAPQMAEEAVSNKAKGDAQGFHCMETLKGVFSDEELDDLLDKAKHDIKTATVGSGNDDESIRRSEVRWLRQEDGHQWLYDRIWQAVTRANDLHFHVDITGFQTSIQLTRYDAGRRGFYTWHMDTGEKNATRKLSFTVQVSPPDAYRGGDLELFYRSKAVTAPRDRGSITVFPSFVMHRVAPVKKGTRYSLVAWMDGPPWR